jgi:hypothetical protein
MQAPTTWTRGHGFTRLTAGAIGLGLLAAATLGAAALTEQVDLPLIGGSSDASGVAAPAGTTKAQIEFFEQNTFEYAVSGPADPALSRSAEELLTQEDIRFLEDNIWDREALAKAAGQNALAAPALSYAQMRFLEDNIWETQQLIPPADTGEANY